MLLLMRPHPATHRLSKKSGSGVSCITDERFSHATRRSSLRPDEIDTDHQFTSQPRSFGKLRAAARYLLDCLPCLQHLAGLLTLMYKSRASEPSVRLQEYTQPGLLRQGEAYMSSLYCKTDGKASASEADDDNKSAGAYTPTL